MRRLFGVGGLALLLIIALAAIGVASALWSKTLTISGTVYTGDVDAIWTAASSSDRNGARDQNLVDGQVVEVDKDVGRLDCTIDGEDPQILYFTVVNGYPSYYADCEGEWTNTGTIPVVVVDLRVDTECPGVEPTSVPFDGWVDMDLDCDGKFDINFQLTNGLCTQIDPGETEANSIKVHVKQDAPQGQELRFTAEIQVNQWNESSPPCP